MERNNIHFVVCVYKVLYKNGIKHRTYIRGLMQNRYTCNVLAMELSFFHIKLVIELFHKQNLCRGYILTFSLLFWQ